MAMSSKLLVASAACLTLAACATGRRDIGQEDLAFGESVRYNAAVQTINPDPIYPEGSAMPGENGDHGAQAVKRYRTDQVSTRLPCGEGIGHSFDTADFNFSHDCALTLALSQRERGPVHHLTRAPLHQYHQL
jgi:hypothetical protein